MKTDVSLVFIFALVHINTKKKKRQTDSTGWLCSESVVYLPEVWLQNKIEHVGMNNSESKDAEKG